LGSGHAYSQLSTNSVSGKKEGSERAQRKNQKEREFLKKIPLPTIAHSLNLEEENKYDFLRYRTIVFIANAWVINLAGKRISVLRWAGVCVSGEKYMSTAAPCRVTSFSALCAAPNVCILSKFLYVLILCATTTIQCTPHCMCLLNVLFHVDSPLDACTLD